MGGINKPFSEDNPPSIEQLRDIMAVKITREVGYPLFSQVSDLLETGGKIIQQETQDSQLSTKLSNFGTQMRNFITQYEDAFIDCFSGEILIVKANDVIDLLSPSIPNGVDYRCDVGQIEKSILFQKSIYNGFINELRLNYEKYGENGTLHIRTNEYGSALYITLTNDIKTPDQNVYSTGQGISNVTSMCKKINWHIECASDGQKFTTSLIIPYTQ